MTLPFTYYKTKCKKGIYHWLKRLHYQISFRPSKLVSATVLLTFLLFLPQGWITWQAYHNFNGIITQELRLQHLSDQITYFDEVLTMSASMNAATGNVIWEERYRKFEPQLDAAIKESIALAPQAYKTEDAKKTDAANKRLVEIESLSFILVRNSQKETALKLLSSQEYKQEKENYALGVASRNLDISLQLTNKVKSYKQYLALSIFASILSLLMLLPAWLMVLKLLKVYLKARNIAQADLEQTNRELENRVENRTQELKDKNIQLQQTLQELQETQVQLIQIEKMSSLGSMVAGIAHEINNPVSFVYGNIAHAKGYAEDVLKLIELYQEEYPKPNNKIETQITDMDLEFLSKDFIRLLKSMEVGTERIQEIVHSLRNFSRLDNTAAKDINIHEGIDSTLMILHHRLKAKKEYGEISVYKEYGSLPLIECYIGQLNQVFMNIISNAIDALDEYNMQRTPDEVKANPSYIRICTDVITDDWVEIRITDNGPGIPENILSQLFEPFFTTKPVGKGTGLGLSISHQIIVEKHHGKLACYSTVGEGTEFVINIPVAYTES